MTEKLKDAIRENIICVDKQNVVLRSFTSRSPSLTKTILSIVGHFVLQKTEKRNYSQIPFLTAPETGGIKARCII